MILLGTSFTFFAIIISIFIDFISIKIKIMAFCFITFHWISPYLSKKEKRLINFTILLDSVFLTFLLIDYIYIFMFTLKNQNHVVLIMTI
jgi:hypothetical protein